MLHEKLFDDIKNYIEKRKMRSPEGTFNFAD